MILKGATLPYKNMIKNPLEDNSLSNSKEKLSEENNQFEEKSLCGSIMDDNQEEGSK